jgi:glycogen debranching enzyme
MAILEAATYFDVRSPEAFAGYRRDLTSFPVEYPTACSPQAWASGAPLLMLRAMLGLEPIGEDLLVDSALRADRVAGDPGHPRPVATDGCLWPWAGREGLRSPWAG